MAATLSSQAFCRIPEAVAAADQGRMDPDDMPVDGAALTAAASRFEVEREALDFFERCLLSADPDQPGHAVETLLSEGLTGGEIADLYVPALARRLGQRWHDDELSFASVTIGSSRLQRLVRDLVADTDAERSMGREAGALLLLVPEAEQHTLGAVLLCSKLRRRGLSVRLWLGFRSGDAAEALSSGSYDGVLISASKAYGLENLQDVITSVRDAAPSDLPVCLGGSFDGPLKLSRAARAAVHMTEDVDEALKICGIRASIQPPARRVLRS